MRKSLRKTIILLLLSIVICVGFSVRTYALARVSVEFVETRSLTASEQLQVRIQITGGQDVSGCHGTHNLSDLIQQHFAILKGQMQITSP